MALDREALEQALTTLDADKPRANGLGGHFANLAAEFPDRVAVTRGDDRRTFAEVDREANRAARALQARGAGQGDAVAIVVPNSIEFIVAAIATWKVGATVVPLSYRTPQREREELYELAEPKVALVETTEQVVGAISVTLDDLMKEAAAQPDDPHPDVVAQPWKAIGSGGSTGRSKLIVDKGPGPITDGAARLFGMHPGGIELIAGPLYHNGPFAWGMLQLMCGGTLALMERFDAEKYLATIEAERVEWSFVVPTMLHRIDELPDAVKKKYDLSSLEIILVSAAPTPAWLKRKSIDLFGATRLWEYYGATEIPGAMIRGDEWLAHPGSVGKPLTGLDLRILDEDGNDVPTGEVGEIFVLPPGGATFTYKGSTAKTWGDHTSVGDLGSLDEDGYLYISDRRTDMIISGGANIFPAEVEAALLEHPRVADVAVVGLNHPDWGQEVHAIVQATDPADAPTEQDLAAFARERIASYKLPKSYEFIAELPRDLSGKLRRSALRNERNALRTSSEPNSLH